MTRSSSGQKSSAQEAPYPQRKRARSKKLLKEFPSEAEIAQLAVSYESDDDATFAIRGCSYLQKMLEFGIRSKFRPLSKEDDDFLFDGGRNGIIASFSNQLRLAFALQLIDFEAYDDLMLMNSIRNAFAHSLHPANFGTEPIVEDCKRLVFYDMTATLSRKSHSENRAIDDRHICRATYHNSIFAYFHALFLITKGENITQMTAEQFKAAIEAIPRVAYRAPWKS